MVNLFDCDCNLTSVDFQIQKLIPQKQVKKLNSLSQ